MGLLGSKYFVNHAPIFLSGKVDTTKITNKVNTPNPKLAQVNYVLNIDMLGRLDSTKRVLAINGVGTSPQFPKTVKSLKLDSTKIRITTTESGNGPSDHASFYLENIPVVHFFTGQHDDYHKPSDDEDKINYYGVRNIVDYVFRVSNEIATLDKIEFTKTAMNAGKTVPKYKVTLGIMPDYTDHGDGLHIDGVTENRPAHAAGILEGDILIKIGDCEIKEVYSYMDCLAKLTAGDEKDVTILRAGKPITVKVKF